MGKGEKDDVGQRYDQGSASLFSRFGLWLAGYYELETISARSSDHLMRDAGLTREQARGDLRA